MARKVIGKTKIKSRRNRKSRKTLKRRQRGGEIIQIERRHNQTYRINANIIGHYEGDWDSKTNKPHGNGQLAINFSGNKTYIGDWVQGKREGQGIMSYSAPKEFNNPSNAVVDIYYGDWKEDKRSGKGKLVRQDFSINGKSYTIDDVNKEDFNADGVTILYYGEWKDDKQVN